jgi:PAS domain S-box-containing protein
MSGKNPRGPSRQQLLAEIEDLRARLTEAQETLRAIREGSVRDYALEIRHKGGHVTPVLYNATVYRDEAGNTVGVFAAARDVTDPRRTEEIVRLQAEEQLQVTLESIGDGFFACDADWRFVYVNAPAERILGIRREEVLGQNHWEVFPLTVGTRLESEYRRAAAGEIRDFESFYEPWGRWFHNRCFPREGGGMSVYFEDITARKQAEEALRRAHETLQAQSEELTAANRKLQVANEELREQEQAQQALRESEAELRRLNEQLEETAARRTGQLTATVDRLQDEVVHRVLAEGKLRKHSQMLEGFFQHTITPLAFLDRRFNFVRVNEAYARADSKDPQYFAGKNHFDLYPHPENQAIFEQVVRTKQSYRAYAKPFTYPDDPQRVTFWNWQLTPLLNSSGEVQSLVLNLQDVTDQQKAYHELEQRTRQLQHLAMELSQAEDRERKRLAEILHDDLQQILAAAKFHLGILSSRIKTDASLQEMAAQLNGMLKEAIDKSRSLSHELSPGVLYQGDLGETFEWLAQQVEAKHGLTVRVETHGRVDSPSEPLKAFLYRTAQEMLFNVVKHAKVRQARLRLKRTRGQLWLTISDQGQGFDPKTLSKTTGFGLLSIRERIELLGGRMKIKSIPNRGSTFLIAVPDPQELEAAAPGAIAEPHARLTKRERAEQKGPDRLKVLLVDDHKVTREGLASLLDEQHDMEVVGQAGNGREAVDLAHKLQPDVIIMDSSMPVMGGDEATRQIKLHMSKIRVIALSMFDEPQMSRKMRRAGAEVYLLKTAPSEELLAAIRGARPAE